MRIREFDSRQDDFFSSDSVAEILRTRGIRKFPPEVYYYNKSAELLTFLASRSKFESENRGEMGIPLPSVHRQDGNAAVVVGGSGNLII